MNVLQIIQAACYEANLPAPTAVSGATDPAILQLVNLFYNVGRELRQAKCWPQMKRTHTITTSSSDNAYALPSDFYASTLDTFWDQANKWKVAPALTDSRMNELLYGYATFSNRTFYRVFGRPNSDQITLYPTPSDTHTLTFDYLSKDWILHSSTWQETISGDTDTTLFDDDLLILGLKGRLYREKGWEWQSYDAEFKSRIEQAQARFQGSLKGIMFPMYSFDGYFPNIADGNFTL